VVSGVEAITLGSLELSRIFLAIALLLLSAHTFGYLFHRIGLPKVIGEIFGGLILGPSVLGHFFPQAYHWIFNAFEAEGKLLSFIYWLGLVMLMFISGFEIQKSINNEDWKLISVVMVGSTAIPFLAGWLAPKVYDFSPYLGVQSSMPALTIIIAIAVAITSIPVISKIFLDLGIINTRFAKIILATATMHDILLWIAMAIATGLVSAESLSLQEIFTTVLTTLAFIFLALLVAPNVIRLSSRSKFNLLLKSSPSGYMLLICFLFAFAANTLDVNLVFGALLAGIVMGLMPQEHFGKAKEHIKDLSLAFFVPIYFAVVGLKIDLVYHFDLLFFLGFMIFATTFAALGTLSALKLAKMDWLSSINISVAMNARGEPGIVLATIAFDLGIINQTFFVTLVLVAIVTSLLAGYWFRYVISRGWPLLKSDLPHNDPLTQEGVEIPVSRSIR